MIVSVMWKDIPGLPGYQVSDDGRVRSLERTVPGRRGVVPGKELKPYPVRNGYLTFRTTGKTHLISRAVLSAFIGPAPAGMQACHNDGDKLNNRLTNLRWDTPKANAADKVAHGTHARGERHPAAKLSNEQVRAILADSRLHKEIAASYGVSTSHVSSIKCGCFRKHG